MSHREEPFFEDAWTDLTLDSVPDPFADHVTLAELLDSPINEPGGKPGCTNNFGEKPVTESKAGESKAVQKKAEENAVAQQGPFGWGKWLGKTTLRPARVEPDLLDLLDMDTVDKPVLTIDAEEKNAEQQKAQENKGTEQIEHGMGETALCTSQLASSGSADKVDEAIDKKPKLS